MSFRKLFVAIAAAGALGVPAGAPFAPTSQQKPPVHAPHSPVSGDDAALPRPVQVPNPARRDAYERSGQAAGTTGAVAGARMFESQLRGRISSGEWYRNSQGQWVQR